MTLLARIEERLDQSGQMPVAEYMQLCLLDADAGYYTRQTSVGGDFTTAPEVSQLFGESLGVWFFLAWQASDFAPATLIDIGGGTGQLLSDVSRTILKLAPDGCAENLHCAIAEASPKMREIQAEKLLSERGIVPKLYASLDEFIERGTGTTFFIANEFFDVLAVSQMIADNGNWRTRMIGRAQNGGQDGNQDGAQNGGQDGDQDGALEFQPGSLIATPDIEAYIAKCSGAILPKAANNGDIFEYSPQRWRLMKGLAAFLRQNGGCGVVIDYGSSAWGVGESLQAIRNGRYSDPLSNPGLQDLTSHVDFSALERAALELGCSSGGVVASASFLSQLAIVERAEQLAQLNPTHAASIYIALERLLGRSHMGELFKVLTIAAGDYHIDDNNFATI